MRIAFDTQVKPLYKVHDSFYDSTLYRIHFLGWTVLTASHGVSLKERELIIQLNLNINTERSISWCLKTGIQVNPANFPYFILELNAFLFT